MYFDSLWEAASNRRIFPLTLTCLLLSAGSCNGPKPSPVPPACDPAKDCAFINRDETNTVACRPYPGDDRKEEFGLYNRHPDREITVRYLERVRHLNDATRPPESISKVARVLPQDEVRLGCEVTAGLFDKVDAWSYRVDAACFTDDCASGPIAAKPVPVEAVRPVDKTCNELCDTGDALCASKRISASTTLEAQLAKALNRFVFEVIDEGDPHVTSMDDVAAVLSIAGTSDCSRGGFEVENGKFDNTGSTCEFGLGIEQPKSIGLEEVNGFLFRFPGIFAGDFSLDSSEALLSSSTLSSMPTITFYDGDNALFGDTVNEVRMEKTSSGGGQITFTTSESYCARVIFDGG